MIAVLRDFLYFACVQNGWMSVVFLLAVGYFLIELSEAIQGEIAQRRLERSERLMREFEKQRAQFRNQAAAQALLYSRDTW